MLAAPDLFHPFGDTDIRRLLLISGLALLLAGCDRLLPVVRPTDLPNVLKACQSGSRMYAACQGLGTVHRTYLSDQTADGKASLNILLYEKQRFMTIQIRVARQGSTFKIEREQAVSYCIRDFEEMADGRSAYSTCDSVVLTGSDQQAFRSALERPCDCAGAGLSEDRFKKLLEVIQ